MITCQVGVMGTGGWYPIYAEEVATEDAGHEWIFRRGDLAGTMKAGTLFVRRDGGKDGTITELGVVVGNKRTNVAVITDSIGPTLYTRRGPIDKAVSSTDIGLPRPNDYQVNGIYVFGMGTGPRDWVDEYRRLRSEQALLTIWDGILTRRELARAVLQVTLELASVPKPSKLLQAVINDTEQFIATGSVGTPIGRLGLSGKSGDAFAAWTLGSLLLHVALGWKEMQSVANGLDGLNTYIWNRGDALRKAMRRAVPVPAAVWFALRRTAMEPPT